MTTKEENVAFNFGIDAAVEYLQGTAEDFEQVSKRINSFPLIRGSAERLQVLILNEKSALLRGQVTHVLELKRK